MPHLEEEKVVFYHDNASAPYIRHDQIDRFRLRTPVNLILLTLLHATSFRFKIWKSLAGQRYELNEEVIPATQA